MRKLIVTVLLAAVAASAQAQSAQEIYQQGLAAERSGGRLKDAIGLYERAIAAAGSNRALAARALLRLGAAYELMGRSEARGAYDRLLREFADQSESAAEARNRLVALDAQRSNGARVSVMREIWTNDYATPLSMPSPDGRLLTYTDWMTGDLAVLDIRSGTARRLTDKGPWGASSMFAEQSVFSPDGARIAYSWFADRTRNDSYELRVVPTAGGASRIIPIRDLVYVQPWAWTPDGRAVLAALEFSDKRFALGIVSLEGELTEITPLHWRWTTSASVSPDGKWVAFDEAHENARHRDIRLVAADGRSAARTVVKHAANDWHPMWTPDGTGVAFLSDRTGAPMLWFQELKDGNAVGNPRVVKADIGESYPIGFSRDGTFFLAPAVSTTDIVVADLDVAAMRIGTPASVTRTFVGQNNEPDWSPDGKSILFVSLRGSRTSLPGERILVTLNLETGAQREYDLGLPRVHRPRWSPDGRSVVFAGSERTSEGMRYIQLDLASEQTRKVSDDITGLLPFAFTAGGRSIVFPVSDSGRYTMQRVDVATGNTTVVHEVGANAGVNGVIAVSPGDSLVAMNVALRQPGVRKNVLRIVRMRDGSVVRELPALIAAGGFANINFTPDGRHIITVLAADSAGEQRRELWAVPIDGSPPKRFDFRSRVLGNVRLSPDGKRVVFVVDDPNRGKPSIWAAEHLVAPAPARR